MNTQQNNGASLESIRANRRLVDDLFASKLISTEAREYALDLLYPAENWGLWASRLLLTLGVALILSGIVYFFAFNWTKITPAIKFSSIEFAIFGCVAASFFYGLHRVPGKFLLLSASVLVGVLLAVFGQIYQTGADAYTLFMVWALLILPWAIISEFAPLWVIWLVISNTFLNLYWIQAANPGNEMEMMIFSYHMLLSGLFLAAREFLVTIGFDWLKDRWTRAILIIPILVYSLFPMLNLIVEPERATYSIAFGALLCGIIHTTFFVIYRYKFPDMWALSATTLSGCVIAETAVFKMLIDGFRHNSDAGAFLLMGMATLGIITAAVIVLRAIAAEMEARHA